MARILLFRSLANIACAIFCLLWSVATNSDAAILERDVLIIGGGAAGTYAATRLHQLGKTVALVEQTDHLGGHVNTYRDPTTGQTFDYGVIAFANISVVRNYFEYLEVSPADFEGFLPDATTMNVDFKTGAQIPASHLKPGDLTAMLSAYQAQLKKYESLTLATGYHLPDPVPEELLLPWGHFLAKHNITSVVYPQFAQGAANALQQLTLYMLKSYNPLISTSPPITTKSRDNQALYDRALAKLGPSTNVVLSSNVTQITRTKSGVVATVNTPSGRNTIKSRQLLMAIPPKFDSLRPFLDLSEAESTLFQQFQNIYVWDGIVANSGIPYEIGLDNMDPTGEGGVPALPASLGIFPSGISGVDVHAIWWGSTSPLPDSDVKADMLTTVNNLQQHLNFSSTNDTTLELVEFHRHSPFMLSVSADAIRNGFYTKLNALQGRDRTWWTGAAWESQNSAGIWNFTEYHVLPGILNSLK